MTTQIDLTMDNLLIGTGWWEVEKVGENYFRWIGPGTSATIHFNIDRKIDYRLNIVVYQSQNEEILKSLKLQVDGVALISSISEARSPSYITAVVPKDTTKTKEDSTILKFTITNKTVKEDANLERRVKRKCWIAIQAVYFFPLKRPLFTAQKFCDPIPFDGIEYLKKVAGVTDLIIHGLYQSAYDYHQVKTKEKYTPELHSKFDECPGDILDILLEKTKTEVKELEKKYQEDISLLREMVYMQGDRIINLENQLKKIKKIYY